MNEVWYTEIRLQPSWARVYVEAYSLALTIEFSKVRDQKSRHWVHYVEITFINDILLDGFRFSRIFVDNLLSLIEGYGTKYNLALSLKSDFETGYHGHPLCLSSSKHRSKLVPRVKLQPTYVPLLYSFDLLSLTRFPSGSISLDKIRTCLRFCQSRR